MNRSWLLQQLPLAGHWLCQAQWQLELCSNTSVISFNSHYFFFKSGNNEDEASTAGLEPELARTAVIKFWRASSLIHHCSSAWAAESTCCSVAQHTLPGSRLLAQHWLQSQHNQKDYGPLGAEVVSENCFTEENRKDNTLKVPRSHSHDILIKECSLLSVLSQAYPIFFGYGFGAMVGEDRKHLLCLKTSITRVLGYGEIKLAVTSFFLTR